MHIVGSILRKYTDCIFSCICHCYTNNAAPLQVNSAAFICNLISDFYINLVQINRPTSWSSGQDLCLLIVRSRVRFPVLLWEFFLAWKDSRGDHGLGS